MTFFAKRRIRKAFKYTDFIFAATVIREQFGGGVVKRELALLFDQFLADPSFETALRIIEYKPDFLVLFSECRPGGIYQVQQRVRAVNATHKGS